MCVLTVFRGQSSLLSSNTYLLFTLGILFSFILFSITIVGPAVHYNMTNKSGLYTALCDYKCIVFRHNAPQISIVGVIDDDAIRN